MRKTIITLLVAAAGLAAQAAWAADAALYRAFGEREGLGALTWDFVGRVKADARIGPYFKDLNRKHLSTQLADQFCVVMGGPCHYDGAPMREAHADLGVTRADFNRLVEVLQDAMDARGIAFADQRHLLALLAPMHREIVTTKPSADPSSR